MAQKIEIPADLTQAYTPPAGASAAELREIAKEAARLGMELIDKDNDEDYAKAEYLSKVVDAVKAEADRVETEDAERKRVRDELKAKLSPGDPDGGEGGDPAPAPTPTPAPENTPEPVLAAAVPSVADIARAVGKPDVKNTRREGGVVALTAAADVPGFSNGQALTVDDLGSAFIARAKGISPNQKGSGQFGFANITLKADPSLVASATDDNIEAVLLHAMDERRLEGGSLVAAGGWCAPSETLYDLLNVSTSEGLISIPEVQVSRGGVKYALGPDFGTVYAAGGFTSLSESQVIGGSTKAVYNIPCPSWTDHRLGVDVAYFTGDILTQRGFPEGITDYITKALIAFDHQGSAATIADMVSGSTAIAMTSSAAPQSDLGAVPTMLGALELQIEDMKYRGRLSRGMSVEVVLPFFARGILRSDLAKRQGGDFENLSATDAQLDALFAVRGANVQYVYDWQDNISTGGSANPFGAEASGSYATQWPQTLKALIYPAGTWARAMSPVIELSTVYDSVLLPTNQYIALFTERSRLTLKKGFDSRVVTLLSNPSGLTSGYVSQSHPAAATLY